MILGAVFLALPGCNQDQRKASEDKSPADKVTVDPDATVHIPPLVVPFSAFASPEAKKPLLENQDFQQRYAQAKTVAEQRQVFEEQMKPALERTKTLYSVDSVPLTIAGVYTDVVTPRQGVDPKNKNRVLINLHGGGFLIGARIMGAMESMPVAALAKIKVVTIDYRQGPENKFPAASEDVATVYKQLLKTYKPKNIGIYGCSAGGVLTAEATAWIAKENLPAPGAVGLFCGSAAGWNGGDSASLALPLSGATPDPKDSAPPHPSISNADYFKDADFSDPMVEPIRSQAVLAKFPPTLIITSTRDLAMSPAVYTHTQLVKLGVDAELHVWEGMQHGFFTTEPDLPEAREVWDVVTKFFDKHLGAN